MVAIITFILWLFIGAYNLLFSNEISKFDYFFCWFVLLLYVMGSMAL